MSPPTVNVDIHVNQTITPSVTTYDDLPHLLVVRFGGLGDSTVNLFFANREQVDSFAMAVMRAANDLADL